MDSAPNLALDSNTTDPALDQALDRPIAKPRDHIVAPHDPLSRHRSRFTVKSSVARDFLRQVKDFYRADLWRYSGYHREVWIESRSNAGVIESDRKELAVHLYPCGGFTSISLACQTAEYIDSRHDQKPVIIFYVGDYDPAGVLIDIALEQELREHLHSVADMALRRSTITPNQIQAYGFSGKPTKERDRRTLHVQKSVEAEAMPARILRRLLRLHVESLLPDGALAAAKAAEESEMSNLDHVAKLVQKERHDH